MAGAARRSTSTASRRTLRVAPEDQVEEQDVAAPREYVDPEDLDRARLLSIEHGDRLRVR